MRLSFFFSIIFLTSDLCGQDLIVAESIDAYYTNGKAISHHDVIPPGTTVRIERKGKLSINYKERWTLYFNRGVHHVDSTLLRELRKPEFVLHDSIYKVLEGNGLLRCRSDFSRTVPDGPHHPSPADKINIINPPDITLISDRVKLEWTSPNNYHGIYYLIIMNLYEEYVGIFQLKNESVDLDLKPFSWTTKILLYKIIAENCRESDTQILRRAPAQTK